MIFKAGSTEKRLAIKIEEELDLPENLTAAAEEEGKEEEKEKKKKKKKTNRRKQRRSKATE